MRIYKKIPVLKPERLPLGRAVIVAVLLSTSAFVPFAMANPEGGEVIGGLATISESGQKLDIHQHSDRVVIDWRSFDIEVDEHTQFHQPSRSATALNRVKSADPSRILGKLSASGNIVLVNPNGVFFGQDAVVDVNGLVVTTADIDTDDFMKGVNHFDRPGRPDAAIVNEGTITAKEAGLVGLVAPNVENHGVIEARMGRVQLASGDTVVADFYGDGLLKVEVANEGVKSQFVGNTGRLEAAGGSVAMTAATARETVNALIVAKGELKAPSIEQRGGKIIIGAAGSNKTGKDGSSHVIVQASLDASGMDEGQQGGSLEVSGDHIAVLDGTIMNASGYEAPALSEPSGTNGTATMTADKTVRSEAAFMAHENRAGGSIKIGGDYLGQGEPQTAKTLYVDDNVLVLNDALSSGDAGRTIFWSDDTTHFNGLVLARGGLNGGNGGFLETSGKINLAANGFADLTNRTHGYNKGTYLLDPANITIYGNFDPNYTSTDSSLDLNSHLLLWLDGADSSAVTLTYSTDSLGAATASGTSGSNTITTSVNVSSFLQIGSRIRLGSQGSVTTADTLGADTYTITGIAGTTITVAEALTSNYTAQDLRRGLVSQVTDKAGANHAVQTTESDMALWVTDYKNGQSSLYFDGLSNGSGDYYDLGSNLNPLMVFLNVNSSDTAIRTVLTTKLEGYPWSIRQNAGFWKAPNSSTDTNDWTNGASGYGYLNGGTNLSISANTDYILSVIKGDSNPSKTLRYWGASEFGSSRYYKGYVPEVYFYDSVVSTAERQLLEQYQSGKYDISLNAPGTGGTEAAKAMASDGYGAFTTRYLERLSASADIVLAATNGITLDLQGDTLTLDDDRSISLTTTNGSITDVSAGTIRTNRTGSGGNISINAGGAGNITLDTTNLEATNGGLVNLSAGGDIDLIQSSDFNLGLISATNVAIESTGGAIGGQGGIIANGGTIDVTANGDIDFENIGLRTADANITLAAGQDLTLSTSINAGAGDVMVTAGRDIFLVPYDVAENLLHHWALDEGSGSIVYDSQGSNPGSLIGDTTWSADNPFNMSNYYSLDFDGSGDRVLISGLNLSSPWSISFWAKLDSYTNTYPNFVSASGGTDLALGTTSTQSFFSSGQYFTATPFTLNNWVQRTYVASGGLLNLYENGKFVESKAYNPSNYTNLTLGAFHTGSYAQDGHIDEVRVYDTALSAGEIGQIYSYAPEWQSGSTTFSAGRDVTLNAVISASNSGNAVVVSSDRNFVNNAGAGALDVSHASGRWLVYSSDPADNTLGGLSADFKRYNKTYAGYAPGSVVETGNGFLYSIAPTLVYQVGDGSVEYGDAYSGTPSVTYSSGLIDGDTLGSIGLSGSAGTSNTYTQGDNVGTYANALTGATGTLTNSLGYGFSFLSGDLGVTKALLTVTADDQSRVYGEANPAFTGVITGYKLGETIAVLDTAPGYATAATNSSDAGTYAIAGSGGADGNYSFTYVNGTLTITKADLNVTLAQSGYSRAQGASNPSFMLNYDGFKLGETTAVLDTAPLAGTTAGSGSPGGQYPITISGGLDNNYNFVYTNPAGSLTVESNVQLPSSWENVVYTSTLLSSVEQAFSFSPAPLISGHTPTGPAGGASENSQDENDQGNGNLTKIPNGELETTNAYLPITIPGLNITIDPVLARFLKLTQEKINNLL